MIKKGDIVFHAWSFLYYICENNQQAKWMNENEYYVRCNDAVLPDTYFVKSF